MTTNAFFMDSVNLKSSTKEATLNKAINPLNISPLSLARRQTVSSSTISSSSSARPDSSHHLRKGWFPFNVWDIKLSPCALHPSTFTLHPAPCTLHPAPCTIHPAPFTMHHSPCTLYPAPYSSLASPCILYVHSAPSTQSGHLGIPGSQTSFFHFKIFRKWELWSLCCCPVLLALMNPAQAPG